MFDNGSIYQGEWLEDQNVMDGKGVLIEEDGTIYEGIFEDGLFHG